MGRRREPVGKDGLSAERRSAVMSRVRSKDTKPEIRLRKALHAMGYRFRLHRKDLPGKPDVVLPRHRTALFVNGCFWHQHPGCRKATVPENNREYWERKLSRNVVRDREAVEALEEAGWRTVVLWECEMPRDEAAMRERLRDELDRAATSPTGASRP